jgi:hypothetical protein
VQIDPAVDRAVDRLEGLALQDGHYDADRDEIMQLCKAVRRMVADGNVRFCAGRVEEAADIAFAPRKHLRYGGRSAAFDHLYGQIHRLKKSISLHRL